MFRPLNSGPEPWRKLWSVYPDVLTSLYAHIGMGIEISLRPEVWHFIPKMGVCTLVGPMIGTQQSLQSLPRITLRPT